MSGKTISQVLAGFVMTHDPKETWCIGKGDAIVYLVWNDEPCVIIPKLNIERLGIQPSLVYDQLLEFVFTENDKGYCIYEIETAYKINQLLEEIFHTIYAVDYSQVLVRDAVTFTF